MDDLLDLNFSSPSRPSDPKIVHPKPSKPSFDFLSKPPHSSSPNYYSSSNNSLTVTPSNAGLTPSTAPLPSVTRLSGPPRPSSGSSFRPTASPVPTSIAAKPGPPADAFSALLNINGGSSNASGSMSMAERAAQMETERKERLERERMNFEDHTGQFWNKFDTSNGARASSSTSITSNGAITPSVSVQKPSGRPHVPSGLDDLDEFLGPSSRPSASAPTTITSKAKSTMGSLWDSDLLQPSTSSLKPSSLGSSSSSNTTNPIKASSVTTLDDFSDFDTLAPKPRALAQTKASNGNGSGMRTPISDFDWGEGKNEEDSDSDDGAPASRRQKESLPKAITGRRPPQRSPSPPPHIVGQIVEMGFSPAQARAALAKTSDGLDVQAALETLLGGSSSSSSRQARPLHAESDDEDEDFVERERQRREDEDRRRRERRAGPSRDAIKPRSRLEREDADSRNGSGRGTPDYQDQAQQYLTQATEIGSGLLGKANSLWNAGKEKAAKLYEEQKRAYEAQQAAQRRNEGRNGDEEGSIESQSRPARVRDGRPKWMVDEGGSGDGDEIDQDQGRQNGGFKDDFSPPRSKKDHPPTRGPPAPSNGHRLPRDEYRSTKDRVDLLFADEPKPYVPASRRRQPISEASTTPSYTPRPVTPVALIQRSIVSATPAQIQKANEMKLKGNEHFKLGRYTESESAYTAAARQLPSGHLHLIAIHNNRAAVRLKLGDAGGVVGDCDSVIEIIGVNYNPSKEDPLSLEYQDVKLGDGLVKAYIKRAQAYEMSEKWKKAQEDWEKLLGMDSAILGGSASATKTMAAEGARRSRNACQAQSAPAISSAVTQSRPNESKPKITSTAKPSDPNKSQAVSGLRKAAAQAQAEDNEKLQYKDKVDARLGSWKSGKETNLRALIASLDTILWDEIMQGVKVGMHELISEKQVKIRYMKVIAKLHPDKLDVKKTTVEQRMIANGVFGALNDANGVEDPLIISLPDELTTKSMAVAVLLAVMNVLQQIPGLDQPYLPRLHTGGGGSMTLIPGPFVLFLLLPSIPLLLFTIGARPPDSSALSFSMMEVFTTAAFVSVAGAVVFSVILYPDVGEVIGGFIMGGTGKGKGATWSWKTIFQPNMGQLDSSGMRQTQGNRHISQYHPKTGLGQIQRFASQPRAPGGIPRTQAGRAALQTYNLRMTFPNLYDPSIPHVPSAIFITCVLLAFFTIFIGHVLKGIYTTDPAPSTSSSPSSTSSSSKSSSSSRESGSSRDQASDGMTPWVMAEIQKRQKEGDPDTILKRFTEDAEIEREKMKERISKMPETEGKEYQARKAKEREKELKVLQQRLEKLDLPLVGLGPPGSESDQAKENVNEIKEEKSGEVKRNVREKAGEYGTKLKRFILPVPSNYVTKDLPTEASARADMEILKQMIAEKNGNVREATAQENGQAAEAMKKSATNAEDLARRMKGGG